MDLTVVGCSGSFPGPESPASCYLVEADDARLVVDLGNGALGFLQRYTRLEAIDAVLLSHLHPDHVLDLCSYYVFRRYRPQGRLPPIPVYGPTGVADRMARAYDLALDPGMHAEFDFVEWVEGTRDIGPFRVTVARVAHPVPTYGMRIEHDGGVLAYSADTGPCAALDRLASGADVLLCEAAFHAGRDSTPDLHLNGRQAGEVAHRAGVRRLVLTHLPPWNDPDMALAEARSTYAGPIELARAGLRLEIGRRRIG